MDFDVTIQWTETAKSQLKQLPLNVRQGLLGKADELLKGDPRKRFKSLTGPLAGYYRIPYSRYRAIYTVEEEQLPDGKTSVKLRVLFVAAGIRKERDKKDVYKVAEKLVRLFKDQQSDQAERNTDRD